MAQVFVTDTSVLIDLHRGNLLETAWRLPYDFAVPDLLFETELRRWEGSVPRHRLVIQSLDDEGMRLAAVFQRADARLSVADVFALALAKRYGYALLAGDGGLRALAETEKVACHGVLWVLDEISTHGLASNETLHAALTTIAQHPRCRLPRREVHRRLEQWSA